MGNKLVGIIAFVHEAVECAMMIHIKGISLDPKSMFWKHFCI